MKVICVKRDTVTVAGPDFPDSLTEGDIYTVVDTIERRGKYYYQLAERPEHVKYSAELFIPLSSIDETEMVREYNKEKV